MRTTVRELSRALFVVGLLGVLAAAGARAQVPAAPKPETLKGAPAAALGGVKQVDTTDRLRHEIWGQSNYGDGYIYGPTNRRSGMTAVDIDQDGDTDFVFPGIITSPQLVRNLGSNNTFVPGGSATLQADPLPDSTTWSLNMDFGDLNGDGLPDLVSVVDYRLLDEDTGNELDFDKRVALYFNQGPRSTPEFSFEGIVHSSEQTTLQVAMWVALGDINGDKLLDLFIAEAFIEAPAPHHRVFLGINEGTPTAPAFPNIEEVPELSEVLPDRVSKSALKENQKSVRADWPLQQDGSKRAKGGGFIYNIGDIAIHDWDLDGVLDFMFYDNTNGLTLVRNEGTPTAPVWNDTIGTSQDTYIYEHTIEDGIDFAEATFAVRENPEAALPGADWTRDIYVSVNSRLKHYRYFAGQGNDASGRQLIQENAVAFPAGQGDVGFWDYDGDGDLDMFRTGVSDTAATNLIMFENQGTPYAPAWAEFESQFSITSVPLNSGTAENLYRNDLFLFRDHDNSGGDALFVQQLDGTIDYYEPQGTRQPGVPPVFSLIDGDFVESVFPGDIVRTPRGFAINDFDQYSDGQSELITVYTFVEDPDAGSEGELHTLRVVDLLYRQNLIDAGMDPSPAYYDSLEGNLPADFLPDPQDTSQPLNPELLESMTSGDLNLDGRPDLIVSISYFTDFDNAEIHYYINEADVTEDLSVPQFRFVYGGLLDEVSETDNRFGRMANIVDIDSDGDNDLFIGHRYPDGHPSNLRSYLRYYRNIVDSGLDVYRQRLVTGQPIDLSISDDPHEYVSILNNSGGVLETPTQYRAGSDAPSIDILESTGLARNARVFLDVLPTVSANESKAIIVVGDTADDSLYDTFATLADFAYFVLESEGLSRDSIRFYADDATNLDGDVAGKPTLANLEDSITNWAQGVDRLLVYLVDHGQRDRFRMNATEYLEADSLDAWYDALQNVPLAERPTITTLIDTCESGTFIDNLQLSKAQKTDGDKGASGTQRITMTSAGVGPVEGVALFDQSQYISFSLNFWFNIFNGRDYGQAYDAAKVSTEAINPLQIPQIDSDGNGVANQGNDSALAFGHRPGANFDIQVPGVFIGDVAPNQSITSSSATLYIGDIVSPFPVDGAGALIVPPNFQRPSLGNDDEQPISGLDYVEFSFNSTTERWEGSYSAFNQGGLFQVQYFVESGGQLHASPRIGFVDRLNTPDAWENDDSPTDANWIPINSVQGHNFHDDGDADWVRFSPLPGQQATIAVINPGLNNRPVVELFRADDILEDGVDNSTPVRTETSELEGEDLVFEQNFSSSEQYFLRVTNQDPDVSGAGTSYLLLVAIGTGGTDLIPTTLIVSVMNADGNAPIEGADVMFDGRSVGKSSEEGICHMSVDAYSTYQLQASKTGFVSSSSSVTVNNIIEEATIMMSPDENGGEGEGEGEGENLLADIAQSLLDSLAANDTDEDGFLSLSEAMAGDSRLTQSQFNELDTDGDGLLSEAELQRGADGGDDKPAGMVCSATKNTGADLPVGDILVVLLVLAGIALSHRGRYVLRGER